MTDEITPAAETPSWFIDEGMPGTGERPAWLSDKFKSAADLAKSYSELEKKFGSPPENYDLSKSRFLDADYAPIQDFLKLARDKRVPGEVMDKMVESIDKYMDEFSVDYNEETKKLGDNANDRIRTLDNWAKANLSKESYEAITNNIKTADGIKALEELRGKIMTNTQVIPNGNDQAASNVATLADIQAEIVNNLPKYKSDPKYRAELQGRLELASKNSGILDKSGP
jgi:hypothetical protein